MARRIQLPSADELFGEGAPKEPSAKKSSSKESSSKKSSVSPHVPKTTAKTTQTAARRTPAGTKRATAKNFPESPEAKRATTRSFDVSPETRLAAIESRLGALPIDSLMDLRDGLEDLLAADTIDEGAVRELLDSIGA